MIVKNYVYRGLYRDSVQLMRISEEAKGIKGVLDAAIIMGTELNKRLLRERGLLTVEGEGAGENDLVVALKIAEGYDPDRIRDEIEKLLRGGGARGEYYYSVESAIEAIGGADLALISIPGEYVKDIALPLIEKGIHLHIFSDHVPIEDEVVIKKKAIENNVLVMGPEAGTSIISGVGIGFANAVERGGVGIIAAAGTGLQELSVLLSNGGLGVSHGIGVGGRDLKSGVGGLSTLFSIDLLERDESTDVIAIVSKPPSRDVAEKIISYIRSRASKKYVICFMGSDMHGWIVENRIIGVSTLHSAALATAHFYGEKQYTSMDKYLLPDIEEFINVIGREVRNRGGRRGFVRGLYTGGTLAYEAQYLLGKIIGPVYSNTPLHPGYGLDDPWVSYKHTVVDLGSEEFTKGRPHPMIDPSIRVERIVREARDRDVGVILMDFVLGYGSHPNPVEAHLEAIDEAFKIAERDGRYLTIIAHVAGTPKDPQNMEREIELLRNRGVYVFNSNALASIAAGFIAIGETGHDRIRSFIDKHLYPGVKP